MKIKLKASDAGIIDFMVRREMRTTKSKKDKKAFKRIKKAIRKALEEKHREPDLELAEQLGQLAAEIASKYSLNKEDAFILACNELNPPEGERILGRELYLSQE